MKPVELARLGQRKFGTRVRVRGRVTHVRGHEAYLADATGRVLLVCDGEPPAEGALLDLSAQWAPPGRLVAAQIDGVQAPSGEFRYAASELAAMQGIRRERLARRASLLRELRAFFDARDFLEVETPLVVPSPGLDVHLSALSVPTPVGERYLITSPEYQMKRLLAGGLERIYQLCKCFRADEVGERHQPEFTMLEWYRAYAGVEDVMRDTEELVAHLARWAATRWPGPGEENTSVARHRLASARGPALLRTAFGDVDVTPPWRRLTMREAFARFCGISMEEALRDEELFYRSLVEHIEPGLAQLGAVFLCEWPASMASLARKKPTDGSVAERFEAYLAGIELCNGFGELTDVTEQRARLVADQRERARLGLPEYPLDERFLDALAQGIPASGGNALGVDRLLLLLLGAPHIEDVLALGASRL